MLRSAIRFLVCVLVFSGAALAQQEDPRIVAFRDFAAAEMKAQQVHGLSVAVVSGDFAWSGGLGLADVENDVPATASTSYRMASVTKPMTATAVLKLVEEGKIDLDAEVQTYVPWFPRKAHPVTIRRLLAHQAGISHYRNYDEEGHIREPKTTREAIAIFADFDLVAEPGTKYGYTSYGYNLLGAVIEGATGRPYAEVMREKVWGPLGMPATLMDDFREVIPHRAPGYVVENGRLRRSEYIDISSRFAGGGTRSTVDDMLRFVLGLAAGKVLQPDTLDRAWSALPLATGRATNYGLGFGVYPRNGRWVVAHSGSQQETRTTFAIVPRPRFAIALASNYEHVDLEVFENELFELFLGDPLLIGMAFDSAADERAWNAMTSVYEYGMAWYDRHGKPMTTDRRELAAAFRAFQEAVAGDEKKLNDGRHPVGGEAFLEVGSYMAAELARKGELDVYHREGALRFFADYARVARRHRIDRALVRRIATWTDERSRVWAPEIASLDVAAGGAALDVLEKQAPALAGSSIKPDFTRELVMLAERKATRGEFADATRAATIGVSIYPQSPGLNGILGVLTLLGGDRERGTALLRTSKERAANGYAGADNLLRIAGFLAGGPMRPGAVMLLEVARELHPDDAGIQTRLAELKSQ